MSEIQRYDLETIEDYEYLNQLELVPRPDGDLCKFSDLAPYVEAQIREAVEREQDRCLEIMRKEFAEAATGAKSIMEDEVAKAVEKEREFTVEAIAARDEYIDLLSEELSEACGAAIVHGWRSSRVEAGEKCRKRIEEADTAVRAAQKKEAKA